MRSKKMLSGSDMLVEARPFAVGLVERVEAQTGSRMAAYERVAGMVGINPSWLRKMIGRSADIKEIAAHEYFNLRAAYTSICQRVEAAAEDERVKRDNLRRQADAADQSDLGLVEDAPRADRGGTLPG